MTDSFPPARHRPGTADSTAAAAKDEAKGVAGQAVSAGSAVVDTAKDEAANVAQEAKHQVKDLLHQTRSELTDQAATQQTKAARGLRSIHEELNSMAENSQDSGVAADLVRQAASRAGSMADWLENRDPGSLLEEIKSFARRRPGAFLAMAAGAGLLAGRLTRSLAAGAPDSGAAGSGTAGSGTRGDGSADVVLPQGPGQPPVSAAPLAAAGAASIGGARAGGAYEPGVTFEQEPVYDANLATPDAYPPVSGQGGEQR